MEQMIGMWCMTMTLVPCHMRMMRSIVPGGAAIRPIHFILDPLCCSGSELLTLDCVVTLLL